MRKPFTEERKRKISEALKGKPKSLAHRKRLSEVRTAKPNRYWLGKKRSDEDIEKFRKSHKGKVASLESRFKTSLALKGDKSPHWKGGITPVNEKIRKSIEYKIWREAVFKRDNYTCVFCGDSKSYLNADHIKPFALYPELRFAIDNGRTLCVSCHRNTPTYGNRKKL